MDSNYSDVDLESVLGMPDPEPQRGSNAADPEGIPFSIEDLDKDPADFERREQQANEPESETSKLRADFDKQSRELAELRSQYLNGNQNQQQPPQQQQQYQQAPPQQQQIPQGQSNQNVDPEAAFNAKFFENPAKAVREMLFPVIQSAIDPVYQANTQSLVESYSDQARRENANWEGAEKYFQQIISDPATAANLAKLPRAKQRETLDLARDVAYGKFYQDSVQRGVKDGRLVIEKKVPAYNTQLNRARPEATQGAQTWSAYARQEYANIKKDNPEVTNAEILAYFKEHGIK